MHFFFFLHGAGDGDDETSSRAGVTADQEKPLKLAIVRRLRSLCSAQWEIAGSVRVDTARSVDAKKKN